MRNKSFLVLVLAFMAFGLSARAAIVTYCDGNPNCTNGSAAFSNAGMMAINFDSAAVIGSSWTDPATLTGFYDYFGGTMTEASDSLSDTLSGFQVGVPANTLTFALDFQTTAGTTIAVDFYTNAGGTENHFTFTAGSSPQFFAVTSDTAITNLSVVGVYGHTGTITEFELQGTGSETPEVGTLLMIGTGLIAMRWMRRLPTRRILFFRSLQAA